MNKNIIVICFGRSGSTNLLDAFVENDNLNYINAAEIFCRGRMFDIIPTEKKNFTFLKASHYEEKATFEKQYSVLNQYNTQDKPIIFKMWVGWHLHYIQEPFYKEFIENSHVILLFRKDIVAQGISGFMTNHALSSLRNVKKINCDPFPLEIDYQRDIEWKIQQLENFVKNVPVIDNLIISEDIFNKDSCIEQLRSTYGIDFYKRNQTNPDYLKKELITNYNEIQAQMIKLRYVSRYTVATNKLRLIAKNKRIIKNVIGKL
jgi:hypothetical protein